ncbi:MAG: hypothetical protein AAF412_12140, partial [Pseudomonadota bacterium]
MKELVDCLVHALFRIQQFATILQVSSLRLQNVTHGQQNILDSLQFILAERTIFLSKLAKIFTSDVVQYCEL